MKKLNRKCPICGNPSGDRLHHQKFKLSSNSVLPDNYDVVACNECGFVFADTSSNQEVYNKYYAEYSKYEDSNSEVSTGGGNSVWDKNRLVETAGDISKWCSTTLNVLDIGSANGGLLLELKALGFNSLFGLDPSKVCVKYVNSLGFTCFLGELFEAKNYVGGRKFDLIILSHVLEHLYDLGKAANVLHGLLTENGMIYIEVPDASNYSNCYVVPYYYFDIEHINHFSSLSLSNLFENNGFELVHTINKRFMVNESTQYPAVYSIFRKTSANHIFKYTKDETVKNEVLKYLELSEQNSAKGEIEKLAQSNEPIVVFGAGNFTSRLLESTPLKHCNILAYVDNDKKKQNDSFMNKTVHSPDFLKNFTGTIVICSALHSNQIVGQLKNELKLENNLFIIN